MKKSIISKTLLITACAGLLLTGCGNKIDKAATLVTIGDGAETISLGYGNFFMRYAQANFDIYYLPYYGEDMWTMDMGSGQTYADNYKESLIDNMMEHYVVKKHASEFGVEVTPEDSAKISDAADKFLSDNSKKALNQLGADKESVSTYLENVTYFYRVRDIVKSQATVKVTDDEAGQSTVSYVFFSTADTVNDAGEDVVLTDEEKKEIQKTAQEMADAKDWEKKAEELEVNVSKHSYTTAAASSENTTLGETVIDAAKALSDGETAVVEVENGYYAIKMEAKHDADATKSTRESLEEQQRNDHFDEVIKGWLEEETWTVNDSAMASVKFDKYFTMAETE